MASLDPIPRPSGKEKLEDIYKNIHTDPAIGASVYGNIRSQIIAPRNGLSDRGWAESYKAGSPNYQTTNKYIDTQYTRTFQPNSFVPFISSPGGFNNYALNYARRNFRHDNRPYYG